MGASLFSWPALALLVLACVLEAALGRRLGGALATDPPLLRAAVGCSLLRC